MAQGDSVPSKTTIEAASRAKNTIEYLCFLCTWSHGKLVMQPQAGEGTVAGLHAGLIPE